MLTATNGAGDSKKGGRGLLGKLVEWFWLYFPPIPIRFSFCIRFPLKHMGKAYTSMAFFSSPYAYNLCLKSIFSSFLLEFQLTATQDVKYSGEHLKRQAGEKFLLQSADINALERWKEQLPRADVKQFFTKMLSPALWMGTGQQKVLMAKNRMPVKGVGNNTFHYKCQVNSCLLDNWQQAA